MNSGLRKKPTWYRHLQLHKYKIWTALLRMRVSEELLSCISSLPSLAQDTAFSQTCCPNSSMLFLCFCYFILLQSHCYTEAQVARRSTQELSWTACQSWLSKCLCYKNSSINFWPSKIDSQHHAWPSPASQRVARPAFTSLAATRAAVAGARLGCSTAACCAWRCRRR